MQAVLHADIHVFRIVQLAQRIINLPDLGLRPLWCKEGGVREGRGDTRSACFRETGSEIVPAPIPSCNLSVQRQKISDRKKKQVMASCDSKGVRHPPGLHVITPTSEPVRHRGGIAGSVCPLSHALTDNVSAPSHLGSPQGPPPPTLL